MLKKNDFYLLVVVVIMASVFSILIANLLFKAGSTRTKVEVVKIIDSNFSLPPDTYFNANSLNPTQTIKIGEPNPTPFKSTQ